VELLLLLPPDALEVLRLLFDDILATGVVPARWLFSLVVPILKEGKPPVDALSYRPVSLTSILARTLERIVLARIDHVVIPQMSTSQFGYRKTLGPDMVLSQLLLDITDGWRESARVKDAETVDPAQKSTVAWALDFTDLLPCLGSLPHGLQTMVLI